MSEQPAAAWRALGGPSRLAGQTLDKVGRRPIWLACWTVLWVLVIWDIYLAADAIDGNTWSEVTRVASRGVPFLPWFMGAFLAHLFHHKDDLSPILDRDASQTLMVLLGGALVAWGLAGAELQGWQFPATALGGVVTAYFLWPRHRWGEWHW